MIGVRSVARGSLFKSLVALAASAPVLASQVPPISRDVEREIAAVLDRAVTLGQRKDTAGFRRLVTPDFRFIHSTGRVDLVSDFLAFVAAAAPDSMRDLAPVEYISHGDAVVVLRHTATWVARRGWEEFLSSDVVVRTSAASDTWRWALHQSTALPVSPTTWISVPDSLLSAYTGEYVSGQGFARSVRRDGDHLTITAVNGAQLPYRAITPNTFHVERGDAYAVFVRDERGEFSYLEMLQPTGAERLTKRR